MQGKSFFKNHGENILSDEQQMTSNVVASAPPPQCRYAQCTRAALFSESLKRYIRECETHRNARLEKDSERRRMKSIGGECMSCSAAHVEGSVYCATHRNTHANRMKRNRTENREAGVCVECGADVVTSMRRCAIHVEQQREYLQRVDNMSPERRRHFAKYCGVCGVFRVKDGYRICTVCDTSRTMCVEYRWSKLIEECATPDGLWPPSASTFTDKKAFGTLECAKMERLVYSDMCYILDDRLVVLECDEFAHRDREPSCELARLDSLQFGTAMLLPTIVLRFNPHDLSRSLVVADFDERVRRFYREHIRTALKADPASLPPLDQVRIVYVNYPNDHLHVVAARNSANGRFEVVVEE